jgi:hypothetical protein
VVSATAVWLLRAQQAESALRTNEARFRDLVEGSFQGVMVYRHFRPLPLVETLLVILLEEDIGHQHAHHRREMLDQTCWERVHGCEIAQALKGLQEDQSAEHRDRRFGRAI